MNQRELGTEAAHDMGRNSEDRAWENSSQNMCHLKHQVGEPKEARTLQVSITPEQDKGAFIARTCECLGRLSPGSSTH